MTRDGIRERFANTPYVPDNGGVNDPATLAGVRGPGRTSKEFDVESIARHPRPMSIGQAGVI